MNSEAIKLQFNHLDSITEEQITRSINIYKKSGTEVIITKNYPKITFEFYPCSIQLGNQEDLINFGRMLGMTDKH